jgi:hypothetical protein
MAAGADMAPSLLRASCPLALQRTREASVRQGDAHLAARFVCHRLSEVDVEFAELCRHAALARRLGGEDE